MDERLEQTLLFDFYGELLNEHQKEIYGRFLQDDLSLGEIAKEQGISRQGVHDLIKRCQKILEGYEEKLHLVEKFLSIKDQINEINEILSGYEDDQENSQEIVTKVRQISDAIIEEL